MGKLTIGGDRLGSGNRQDIQTREFQRSNHDLGYLWRSTMSAGTLVPFMTELGLPGDTFDINLDCNVMTHPTIGPLFGSYKVQLDVFQIPIRLYNGKLHNNSLNVGLKMSEIKLPQLRIISDSSQWRDNSQINPSSLLAHLNIRGIGKGNGETFRDFNAVPYLGYWDIYKQYYANKSEEIGVMIHNNQNVFVATISNCQWINANTGNVIMSLGQYDPANPTATTQTFYDYSNLTLDLTAVQELDTNRIGLVLKHKNGETHYKNLNELYNLVTDATAFSGQILCSFPNQDVWDDYFWGASAGGGITGGWWVDTTTYTNDDTPKLQKFDLVEIDNMRNEIIASHNYNGGGIIISSGHQAPYGLPLMQGDSGKYCLQSKQEGLAIKTYQSDIFNNWINDEWITGTTGVNAISSVSTVGDKFTIDALNIAQKVYYMLNKIALSGGSYNDWLKSVYEHNANFGITTPVYAGGLSKELTFTEVISNTATAEQPLGTLAGRGVMTNKHKGGNIIIKVNEPCYIMGIVSLTPRIDYSQGNKWDTNLKTLDDLHKPHLDEIGYQDLITENMAWWDSDIDNLGNVTMKSAGKVPAWIHYMTNHNVCRGNFAEENDQMFMTLNRRYEQGTDGNIKDLTTYIDPSKFNNIFADTRLDAQNFWTQIKVDINARRKISAKVMPNL